VKPAAAASPPAGELSKRHPRQLLIAAILWALWLAFLAAMAVAG
jgi:hypothetical protein